MEYILSKGIAPNRIISQGYGETKPVVPNDTDENRQLNRRVEFKILKN
jgi:outer membrane protein OmpA-like peptidoglycan-associated protein